MNLSLRLTQGSELSGLVWGADCLAIPRKRGLALALRSGFVELLHFGWAHALACLFPAYIFLVLGLCRYLTIPGMYRYDFALLACLLMQAFLYWSQLESAGELKVITLFHLIGLALEIYKVQLGSWSYPEEAWTKVFGVPVYSGFMYASVASYMCQVWHRFDLRLTAWPRTGVVVAIGTAIYVNFLLNRWFPDIRWPLFAVVLLAFHGCSFELRARNGVRRMPVVLAFFLVAVLVWFGENMGTFLGAWQYPHQRQGWAMVDVHKLSSWFLLVFVSGMIVAHLKHVREESPRRRAASRP